MEIALADRFYEFDRFRIEVGERRLLSSGEPVRLMPKDFDVLLLLIENNGRTLSKVELIEHIWPDTFVDEGNLYRHVSNLRKVLGDGSFIKTVPKHGYRFEGDVRRAAVMPPVLRETTAKGRERSTVRPVFTAAIVVFVTLIAGAFWMNGPPRVSKAEALMPPSVPGTPDADALELYRSGRAHWQDRTAQGLHQATVDLEHAVAKDPNFALAHAALADAYAFDVVLWRKAEPAALAATGLDPSLGQPHATLGFIRTFWQWELQEAEKHFRTALKLSPEAATTHQWYAINLVLQRRGGAAVAEMTRALELEPGSLAINADLCQLLYFQHKYNDAAVRCLKTLEMDPGFINAHSYLYDIYTEAGDHDLAVAEHIKAEELDVTAPGYLEGLRTLRQAYESGGIRAYWQKRIELLQNGNSADAYRIAKYKARLGLNDEALDWLERAVNDREFDAVYFAAEPAFKHLRRGERFDRLLAAYGPAEAPH